MNGLLPDHQTLIMTNEPKSCAHDMCCNEGASLVAVLCAEDGDEHHGMSNKKLRRGDFSKSPAATPYQTSYSQISRAFQHCF